MATLVMTDIQHCSLAINYVDAKGNPATPARVPVWTVTDDTILTVTAAADGMSADVARVGALGTATVSVVAEGDPTPGVDTVTGALDVNIVSSEATAVNIVPGTPANI